MWGEVKEAIPADVLTSNGHTKTVASVISALVGEPPLSLRDIAANTDLSTSQASSGLRQCRYNGWVTSSEGESEGRGRPAHLWRLTLSPLELIREIEAEVRQEHTSLSDALENLPRVRERA